MTVRQKPYLTCNDCGLQMFFRGQEAIRRLLEMLGEADLSANVRAISNCIEYGRILKARLQEVRAEKPILGRNSDLEIEEQLIERELNRIRGAMKSELEGRKREVGELDE